VNAERFEIARPLDLQLAVLRCQRSALLLGATELERSVIATIVSELGSNVLKYAAPGTVEVRRIRRDGASEVEIVAFDAGPGIPNVELALSDHYSTGRTLGLGLPGVRRMADELEIRANPDGGTTVRVRKRLSGAAPRGGGAAETGDRWQAAAAVRPRGGSRVAGDLATVVDGGDHVLLAIVDATGHGPAAHAVARELIARLRERFAAAADPADVAAQLRDLHEACIGTIGAAAGIGVIDTRDARLAYLAVGNVRAAVVGARPFTGVSRDGILGRRWPTPFVQRTTLERGDLLLMWTDGLPEALARSLRDRHHAPHPGEAVARLADRIVEAHAKRHDDAACLVTRWHG
jgi:anti-sigma regulatory factor (Ser/Thr protein kinase)